MHTNRLDRWFHVLSNVGILVGLLLVIAQMRQNEEILKTQILFEDSRRAVDLELQVIGENSAEIWAKSISDPLSLSLAERRQMEALLWSYTEQLRSARLLGSLGLLDDDEWRERARNDTGFYFGSPFGKAWWANFSSSPSLPKDLVAVVNAHLAELPDTYTLEYMNRIPEQLHKERSPLP